MFILRSTGSDFGETNLYLGDFYQKILRETNSIQFERTARRMFGDKWNAINLHGFIVHNCGMDDKPLYSGVNYYILSSDGKIFDSIVFK